MVGDVQKKRGSKPGKKQIQNKNIRQTKDVRRAAGTDDVFCVITRY